MLHFSVNVKLQKKTLSRWELRVATWIVTHERCVVGCMDNYGRNLRSSEIKMTIDGVVFNKHLEKGAWS